MLSDVPIAFFLSGGLDSSLLAAMVRKPYPMLPMVAYTIDTNGQLFSNEGFEDDLPYARKVAKNLAIDLESFLLVIFWMMILIKWSGIKDQARLIWQQFSSIKLRKKQGRTDLKY